MSTLVWPDYVVFAAMLMVSVLVGLYFAYKSRHQSNPEQFLMAGRNMQVLPVAFSVIVSYLSAVSIVGDPVECYRFGFIYVMVLGGYVLSLIAMSYLAPKYQELRITSIFEIMEKHYGKGMRIAMCVGLVIQQIIYQGIVMYATALAISQAVGLPVWVCITVNAIVCTVYTTIGGMKAVIWTDAFQMTIMLAGLFALLIQGSIRLGGIRQVFAIAAEGGRINFNTSISNFNPLAKAAFWWYLIGGFFRIFTIFLSNQHIVQRFCIVKSPEDARKTVLITIPVFIIFTLLLGITGLIMYGFYGQCDPRLNGDIQRTDQLLPLLIIELLGFMPGIPGLFLATLFSASLSTLSSGMNALSAIGLSDVIMPLYQHMYGVLIPQRVATIAAKLLVVGAGIVITAVSFLPEAIGSSIFAVTNIFQGALTGPCSAVFFIAMVFPKIRSLFVYVSWAFAMSVCLVISLMSFIMPPREPWEELPVTTDGCDAFNSTSGGFSSLYNISNSHLNSTVNLYTPQEAPGFSIDELYHLNTLLYAPLGFGLVMGIASFLQMATNLKHRMLNPTETKEQIGLKEVGILEHGMEQGGKDVDQMMPLKV